MKIKQWKILENRVLTRFQDCKSTCQIFWHNQKHELNRFGSNFEQTVSMSLDRGLSYITSQAFSSLLYKVDTTQRCLWVLRRINEIPSTVMLLDIINGQLVALVICHFFNSQVIHVGAFLLLLCYGLNVCVPLEFIFGRNNPQCDGIRTQGLWSGIKF